MYCLHARRFLNILFDKDAFSPGKLISELKAKQKWAR